MQRDLRSRSREIMDSVEHGQSFTATRDGERTRDWFRGAAVARAPEEFTALSRNGRPW